MSGMVLYVHVPSIVHSDSIYFLMYYPVLLLVLPLSLVCQVSGSENLVDRCEPTTCPLSPLILLPDVLSDNCDNLHAVIISLCLCNIFVLHYFTSML